MFNKPASTDSFPIEQTWHRERKIVNLLSINNPEILLQIHKQDADANQIYNIGVDDFQVLPCLSTVPEMLNTLDGIFVRVYTPTQNELSMLGLAHIMRTTDYWSRLHVTVGLELERKAANCEYEISLEHSMYVKPVLDMLGCNLIMSVNGVRGSYAECQIAMPVDEINTARNTLEQAMHFVAKPTSIFAAEDQCALTTNAQFMVYLRSHVALYECPSEMFMDKFGNCQSCHDFEQHANVCDPGFRLRGCPVFTEVTGDSCTECVILDDDIQTGRTEFAPVDAQNPVPCRVQCKSEYFGIYLGGDILSCVECSEAIPCAIGHTWQNCSRNEDAHCAPCTNLDSLGLYAFNEEFVAADSCDTRCKDGFYRDFHDQLNMSV